MKLLDRQECVDRLQLIFPAGVVEDPRAVSGPLAGAAADRNRWYSAALRGHRALIELLSTWRIDHRPWYADNSREPLRDETFREWLRLGAMEHDSSIPTTSPRPAWNPPR